MYFQNKECFTKNSGLLVLQRCKDRLTKSRERLVSRFRNLDSESPGGGSPGSSGVESSSPGSMAAGRSEVQPAASGHMDTEDPVKVLELSVKEAMMEEWEQMRTENLQLPSLSSSRKRVVPFPDTTDLDTPRRKSPYLSPFSSSEDEFDVSLDGMLYCLFTFYIIAS